MRQMTENAENTSAFQRRCELSFQDSGTITEKKKPSVGQSHDWLVYANAYQTDNYRPNVCVLLESKYPSLDGMTSHAFQICYL